MRRAARVRRDDAARVASRPSGAAARLRRWLLALLRVAPLLAVLLCAACSQGSAGPPVRATVTPPAGPTPTPHPGLTYVAIGASDAFGLGTDQPARDNWPAVLTRTLGPSVHLVNLGIPGATVDQANRDELPIALDSHPDIITVFLGVNDLDADISLADVSTGLRALLDQLTRNTSAHIFVGNLPDLALLPYFAAKDNASTLIAEVQHWNQVIASICKAEGTTLVDLYSGWGQLAEHPEYIAPDGLHPSTKGAVQLADLFATAIEATLPDLGPAAGAAVGPAAEAP
jgi:lysophospholipase L1-like esterase